MSLIFEALKKLEREKQAPERGILVVGPTQWAGGGARVRLWVVVAGALALLGLGVAIGAVLRRPPEAAPASPAQALAVVPVAPPSAPLAAPAPPAKLDLGPPAAAQAPVQAAAKPRLGASAPPATVETPKPASAGPHGPVLTLQAVTEQDGVPVALINDRLMRVGDAFEGVKVLSIGAGAVEVEIEATGERRTLTF